MEIIMQNLAFLFVLFFQVIISSGQGENETATVLFSISDLDAELHQKQDFTLKLSESLNEDAVLYFLYDDDYTTDPHYLKYIPNITVKAHENVNKKWTVNVTGINAGHTVLGINSSSPEIKYLDDVFVRIDIVHNKILIIISAVIGWIYFVAWSISFYPQLYVNWKRKSVVGLSFDFLLYNITGFTAYGVFNVGMFWIDSVKDEYRSEHKHGINPVQVNDVIFTLHAIFITAITIVQCFLFERGGQKPSKLAVILVSLSWLFAGISLFVTVGGKITWLTYLYYFSYIKLGVTLIKYIPQAVLNFRRKSTEGWSIGNILLDFTGGSLSLLQMFILAFNSDDWSSIFGDLTKFGLGLFSVLFDILFMIQHYILYRGNTPYSSIGPVDSLYQESADVEEEKGSLNKSSYGGKPL